MNNLTDLGFRLVYNFTYNHLTTYSEIMSVRSQCTASTIICVGNNRYDETFLRLVACANCLNVTTENSLFNPTFYGEAAYWYFTNGKSFGFVPIDTISQRYYAFDIRELNSRILWDLNGVSVSGLGNATWLAYETFFKKIYLN